MNLLSMVTKTPPQTLSKLNRLCDVAKENETLCNLFERLDGCDARDAYYVLSDLSDHELKILAAFIGETNAKFGRRKVLRK